MRLKLTTKILFNLVIVNLVREGITVAICITKNLKYYLLMLVNILSLHEFRHIASLPLVLSRWWVLVRHLYAVFAFKLFHKICITRHLAATQNRIVTLWIFKIRILQSAEEHFIFGPAYISVIPGRTCQGA